MLIPLAGMVILDLILELPDNEMIAAIPNADCQDIETIELCRILMKGNTWPEVTLVLKSLKTDPEKTRQLVLSYMNSVLISAKTEKVGQVASNILDYFEEPFFNGGKAALSNSCFKAFFS